MDDSESDEYSDDGGARAGYGRYGGQDDSMDGDFRPSPQLRADPKAKAVSNQPFDEAVDLSSDDSEDSPAVRGSDAMRQTMQRPAAAGASRPQAAASQQPRQAVLKQSTPEEDSDEDDDSDDGDEGGSATGFAGGYNPQDYMDLPVSGEVRELFAYITRYKPQEVELETRLRPFIPDYLPAVGELDAFLKIPRPDGEADNLGLIVLDEPAANQSDPTVLDLQLRAFTKQSGLQPMVVRSVENAEKNPKMISNWIASIEALHRDKPAAGAVNLRPMGAPESQTDEWPSEFEDVLAKVQLPGADLDIDLNSYGRIVCALLDVPIYQNVVESLHQLFSVYIDFQSNVHFQAKENEMQMQQQFV
eukprot:TRINITY_DN3766_c0_g1_i1.p1 TRINITY_DN3766_c0_g1~~TRINITY_DN3766_c0_g1_i1.p1  ORF type:complete len:360 (+),score=77.63 TRINITY_DN3766_c0_g1_i1:52-1131(+)